MAKRIDTNTTRQFTAKVHRQHSSLVITIPKALCQEMMVSQGDILLFEIDKGDVAAVVGKMALRGSEYARDNRG